MADILRMYRGDDRTFTVTVAFDGAATDLSAALDITFTARVSPSESAEAPITLHLFDGVEYVTDGSDGKLAITIPGSSTTGLNAGTVLRWDVEVQGLNSSGEAPSVRTWPEGDGIPVLGKLVVVGDVTRAAAS